MDKAEIKKIEIHIENSENIKKDIEENIQQCNFKETVINYKAFHMHLRWTKESIIDIDDENKRLKYWKQIEELQNQAEKTIEKIPLKCKCKMI